MRCSYCDEEIVFPHKCSLCGLPFCSRHRLPENHKCTKLSKTKNFWYQKEKLVEKQKRKAIMRGEKWCVRCGSFSTEVSDYDAETITYKCLSCGLKWTESKGTGEVIHREKPEEHIEAEVTEEPEPKPVPSPKSTRKRNAVIMVTCIVIVALLMGLFINGIRSTAYETGFLSGKQTGFNEGYELGFGEGNQSGYPCGYEIGNSSGYEDGFSTGNTTGFSNGYVQGVEDGVGRGYNIRDPTYEEALQFISSDQTDENEHTENYTCFNFAADFEKNAFEAGYRCGWVYVEFTDGAHAIVCFNTTNLGLIFIEPQDDTIVELSVGHSYDSMGLVIYFAIIW